jgi:hypothetical protein
MAPEDSIGSKVPVVITSTCSKASWIPKVASLALASRAVHTRTWPLAMRWLIWSRVLSMGCKDRNGWSRWRCGALGSLDRLIVEGSAPILNSLVRQLLGLAQ